MKSVVCFGDSNTWGHVPGESTSRFPYDVRWTGRLQRLLGNGFLVIEEGLNGRTAGAGDPLWNDRNGRTYLPIVLETHVPIDYLIIMLGTNDIKARMNLSPFTIAQCIAELIELAKGVEVKHIVVVSPPPIVPTSSYESTMSYEGAAKKSQDLAAHYRYFADKYGCRFVDAGRVISSSPIDGIHLDENAHQLLAEELSRVLLKS